MASAAKIIGEVLDDKYLIENELGKGGMGAVYSATHLGTDRPVAVKVIAPQFMRNDEFVERFKREAKAAGRLRHPNVVNVTDFGFAKVGADRVAYLVMEFLDGCTLAEVLEEESQLSVGWVVDILEQACSALDTAHRQGIVHRDLKPDNIWLEPNRRGGYRVKVLDFGLAKLGESIAPEVPDSESKPTSSPQQTHGADQRSARSTKAALETRKTQTADAGTQAHGRMLEAATQLQPAAAVEEATTLIQNQAVADARESEREATTRIQTPVAPEDEQTQVLRHDTAQQLRAVDTASAADGLTRVGSILGTPLYMSPEQCRSEAIDSRTDIYSLGVIAYQMIAGTPPFTGDMNTVMRLHMEAPPPPLSQRRKGIPKKLARVVMSALAKNPADRPSTAAGFASALRAYYEDTGHLLRRAFALYAEYFPNFFRISLLMHLPLITINLLQLAITILMRRQVIAVRTGKIEEVVLQILLALGTLVASSVVVGVTIRLVAQLIVAPLRPLQLRLAFAAVKKRLGPLVKTTLMVAVGSILGLCLLVIPGVLFYINSSLSSPVVMMEKLSGRAAIRRSKALVKRARRTVIAIILIQYAIPTLVSSVVTSVLVIILKGGHGAQQDLLGNIAGLIQSGLNIFLVPLIAALHALLYLKARQAGGESLREVMNQFEEDDRPTTKWELRMRERASAPHITRAQ
jgi:serine/threonine protein kinase